MFKEFSTPDGPILINTDHIKYVVPSGNGKDTNLFLLDTPNAVHVNLHFDDISKMLMKNL